jgi:hypothetical protein
MSGTHPARALLTAFWLFYSSRRSVVVIAAAVSFASPHGSAITFPCLIPDHIDQTPGFEAAEDEMESCRRVFESHQQHHPQSSFDGASHLYKCRNLAASEPKEARNCNLSPAGCRNLRLDEQLPASLLGDLVGSFAHQRSSRTRSSPLPCCPRYSRIPARCAPASSSLPISRPMLHRSR